MVELHADDFAEFFQSVHSHEPFPWQERLLRSIAETGRWPDLLDLPTGSGKTATLDIALFHLALEAGRSGRSAPLRIVLVVDRRTIVDQAGYHAHRLRDALDSVDESGCVIGKVRAALARLSGGGTPLCVTTLRGGMPRDDGWARRPDQPTIATSTVDQVGSRLLFRGYGVSPSMRPVHAGLLGNDVLFLLDEVHLAEPFRQTLQAVHERYQSWRERELPDRWQVVEMSATPGDSGARACFTLDADDERHRVLAMRLRASKPTSLEVVQVRGQPPRKLATFASRLAEIAGDRVAAGRRRVAVVVNRVPTARAVAAQLSEAIDDAADVWLVTGRMRPIERDERDHDLRERVGAGVPRQADDRPVVVVATQCIEAGADLDFDALVTECASLDAVRQRFGRLNRLGQAPICEGFVVVRSDSLEPDDDDPIYGAALRNTWHFLSQFSPLDLGCNGLVLPDGDEARRALIPSPPDAPLLLPAHLDLWVRTWPAPMPDPDPSLWLHGNELRRPEVQVIWRSDVTEELLAMDEGGEEARMEELRARMNLCPPSSLEALSVPLVAARRWLARQDEPSDLSDIEGCREPDDHSTDEGAAERTALAWRGDDSRVIQAREIRPGDTLVVPSEYGGLSDLNWDAQADSPVADLGAEATWAHRRRAVLRLVPALWAGLLGRAVGDRVDGLPAPPEPSPTESNEIAEDAQAVRAWLEALREHLQIAGGVEPGRVLEEIVTHLLDDRAGYHLLRFDGACGDHAEGTPWFALGSRRPAAPTGAPVACEIVTEGDLSSFTGAPEVPTLRDHLAGVGEFARAFAERCGLPSDIVADIELAARWHDAGKADPRFQRMLHGGDAFKALTAPEPIAKSGVSAGDRRARDCAWRRSKYPKGARHELMSVALLERWEGMAHANDRDLVLHLVASHHGWCRPLAPVAIDGEPVEVEFTHNGRSVRTSSAHQLEKLDSGVCDRFWRLVPRYGWWGLAWLEAILRLADHRRSEAEQVDGAGGRRR